MHHQVLVTISLFCSSRCVVLVILLCLALNVRVRYLAAHRTGIPRWQCIFQTFPTWQLSILRTMGYL